MSERYISPDEKLARAEESIERLEGALKELRARYHGEGRRPEECYEMSLIDDVLRGARHE